MILLKKQGALGSFQVKNPKKVEGLRPRTKENQGKTGKDLSCCWIPYAPDYEPIFSNEMREVGILEGGEAEEIQLLPVHFPLDPSLHSR
jgi:hypothetical protein